MTLDPNARASWQGFLDLLRPPDQYTLRAALGTSYGVGFDALLAQCARGASRLSSCERLGCSSVRYGTPRHRTRA